MNYNLSKLLKPTVAIILLIAGIMMLSKCNPAAAQTTPKQQQTPPPTYLVQGDINYWQTVLRLIQKAQQATYQSKLTASEAMPIIDSLTLFTSDFLYQFHYQDSVRLAVAKPKPDTTSKHK